VHGYPELFYNVACCESLAGDKDAALEHLRRAVELRGELRSRAEGDSDLDAIREVPTSKETVSPRYPVDSVSSR
jgi:hypothetical protein